MDDEGGPDATGSETPVSPAPPPLVEPGAGHRPAFYAARPGGWRDWWTLLHPPYTAWHLAYVVIGACLAPNVDVTRLVATLLAFLFAVGFAAHALDELHGRPLGTSIPTPALVGLTLVGLAGAIVLGIVGLSRVGWPLIPFMVLGPLLVVAYNLELFGGFVHTDAGFALAWGSFPVLVAYVAQTGQPGREPGAGRTRRLRVVGGPTPAEYPGSARPSPGGRGGRWRDLEGGCADPARPGHPVGPTRRGARRHVVGRRARGHVAGRRPPELIVGLETD